MKKQNFIDGQWLGGSTATPDVNPSNTSDVIDEYAQADRAQAEAAIASARRAFPKWALASVQPRADILDQIGSEILARKEELGTLLSREEGKTRPEGIGEAARAGYIFKFFAGEAIRAHGELVPSVRPGIDVEITREPVGVVGMITPWNFPLAIPAWKIAPALAFGNCVVFKPADLVPGSAWALAEIISRTALPAGVFNLVMGRGSVVGDAIVRSPDVDAISFTGSVPTGKNIARTAIEPMKKLQLEMGGKNPQVILDDADLDVAVNVALQSAYFSTGQRCTAASRLIVTEGIHDRFVEALTKRMCDAQDRRCAEGRHRHRPGGRPEPARPGPELRQDREGGRRQARGRRRAVEARHRGLLHVARADHRDDAARCASTARKCSARWRAWCASRTTTRRWRWPTTRRSA